MPLFPVRGSWRKKGRYPWMVAGLSFVAPWSSLLFFLDHSRNGINQSCKAAWCFLWLSLFFFLPPPAIVTGSQSFLCLSPSPLSPTVLDPPHFLPWLSALLHFITDVRSMASFPGFPQWLAGHLHSSLLCSSSACSHPLCSGSSRLLSIQVYLEVYILVLF